MPLTNWAKVPEQVDELVANLASPAKDTVADLAKVHASFEQIHPFSDGNGRTGRLLMLAQALRAQLMPPIVENERRYAYYKYLELAQTKDALAPLELFIARSLDFTSRLLTDK